MRLRRAAAAVLVVAALTGVGALDAMRSGLGPPNETQAGSATFSRRFTPTDGLGPLYNDTSCAGCHVSPSAGGVGKDGLATVLRVGRTRADGSEFDAMLGQGGPIARAHSITELGFPCTLQAGVPTGATVTSVRNTPPVFGDGLIDAIPESVILAGAMAGPDGVAGQANLVAGPDGALHVGRFGWKADTPSLRQFVGEAFRNELGLTNPVAPKDLPAAGSATRPPCSGESSRPKDDGTLVQQVTTFISNLPGPAPLPRDAAAQQGAAVFDSIGCASCHVPSLSGERGPVPVYSDLLLHDMGPALDDGVVQGQARGSQWRTAPLWGLHLRPRLLHDGRARTLEAALMDHAGEAAPSAARFRGLEPDARAALLAFLATL